MTQLLISVKNVEESILARSTGADIIDLKNPSVGALGALPVDIVSEVLDEINGSVLVSATVGEGHESVDSLLSDIKLYAGLGVDIIKIAVSDLFIQKHFFADILKLIKKDIKLVAVFFADQDIDFNLLPHMQSSGFHGAMLDTQKKETSLLTQRDVEYLNRFVGLCHQYELASGLAGSLKRVHMNALLPLNANFIGVRGGVCRMEDRVSDLSPKKIVAIKEMLLNYNNDQVNSPEN
ncbi:MAG: (5-formylfuran-3-yl)methyl phosphate synthase, partial [Methylophilaceae bacterium]